MIGDNVKVKKENKVSSPLLFSITLLIVYIILMFSVELINGDNSGCCQCGDTRNTCCPCPNYEYIDNVSDWIGYKPSGAGAWEHMCREYKEEHNQTWECFR